MRVADDVIQTLQTAEGYSSVVHQARASGGGRPFKGHSTTTAYQPFTFGGGAPFKAQSGTNAYKII